MKTVFDLSQHSSVDLARLEMAIQSGINDCGDNQALSETKETLYAYKNIVYTASKVAAERESDEWATRSVQEIIGSNGLTNPPYNNKEI